MYKTRIVFTFVILLIGLTFFNGCATYDMHQDTKGYQQKENEAAEKLGYEKNIQRFHKKEKDKLENISRNGEQGVADKRGALNALKIKLTKAQSEIENIEAKTSLKRMEKINAKSKIRDIMNRIKNLEKGDTSKLKAKREELEKEFDELMSVIAVL